MLKVTPTALSRIKREMQPYIEDGKEWFVRLHMGIGWGGPRLQLTPEESADPNDQVIQVDDVKLLIDKSQTAYFDGCKLDYTKSFFGLGQYQLLRV